VNPAVKYTLARLGILAVVLLALWPVNMNVLLKLAVAVLFSAAASWFLLRGLRDEVTKRVEGSMARRTAEREKLRAALAGEQHHTPEEIAEAAAAREKTEADSAAGPENKDGESR
jgi:hypothetical protein